MLPNIYDTPDSFTAGQHYPLSTTFNFFFCKTYVILWSEYCTYRIYIAKIWLPGIIYNKFASLAGVCLVYLGCVLCRETVRSVLELFQSCLEAVHHRWRVNAGHKVTISHVTITRHSSSCIHGDTASIHTISICGTSCYFPIV